jgi:hypothetical protein
MKKYIYINKIAVFLGVLAVSLPLHTPAHAAIDLLAVTGIKPSKTSTTTNSILAIGKSAVEDPSKAMTDFRKDLAKKKDLSSTALNETLQTRSNTAIQRVGQQKGIQQGYIAQSQQAVSTAQGFWKAKVEQSGGSGGGLFGDGGLLGSIGGGLGLGNLGNLGNLGDLASGITSGNLGGLTDNLSLDSVTSYAQNAASGYIDQKVNEITSNATSQVNGVIGTANGYVSQTTNTGQSLVSQGQSILSSGQKAYSTGTEIYNDATSSFGSSSGWLDIKT